MGNMLGGPAFPLPDGTHFGMSLRDYFAAAAMQGLTASRHSELLMEAGCPDYARAQRDIAKEAYQYADAMLEARK